MRLGEEQLHDSTANKISDLGFSSKYVAYFNDVEPSKQRLLFKKTGDTYRYVSDIEYCKVDRNNQLRRGIAVIRDQQGLPVKIKMSSSCMEYNKLLSDEVQAQKIVDPKLPAYYRAKIPSVIENAQGELLDGEMLSYARLRYEEGVSLKQALESCANVAEKQQLMRRTLEACFDFYKSYGFFPTDLSSGNVVVNDQNEIRFIDYGSYFHKGQLYGSTLYTESGYQAQANHPTQNDFQVALELFFLQFVRLYNDAVQDSNFEPLPNCQELFFRFWDIAHWSVEDCFKTYLSIMKQSVATEENLKAVEAQKKHIIKVRGMMERQVKRLGKIPNSPIAETKSRLFSLVLEQLPSEAEVASMDAHNLYSRMDKLRQGLDTLEEGFVENLAAKQKVFSAFKALPKEVQVLIEVLCWITILGKIIKAIIDGVDSAPTRSENAANKALSGYRPLIAKKSIQKDSVNNSISCPSMD